MNASTKSQIVNRLEKLNFYCQDMLDEMTIKAVRLNTSYTGYINLLAILDTIKKDSMFGVYRIQFIQCSLDSTGIMSVYISATNPLHKDGKND